MEKALWSVNPNERLVSARALSASSLESIQANLAEGCPAFPWPYGMPTVVNPFVVILGVSPGNSPNANDSAARYGLPTAGTVHPGFHYEDTKGFWRKTRYLTRSICAAHGIQDTSEADALSGLMNLGDGRSGSAADAKIDDYMLGWVFEVIFRKLRPEIVVCFGLSSLVRSNDVIRVAFEKEITNFKFSRPHSSHNFKAYVQKNMTFREWRCKNGTQLVFWPNHPSRVPFVDEKVWETSVDEFCLRSRAVQRRR